MEWTVQPLALRCASSGHPLEVGDSIVSLIFTNERGEMMRADVLAAHASSFVPGGTVLGKWAREVRPRGEQEREARKQQTATAEELFLSLFEETEENIAEAHLRRREALRQLLALLLERKRVLRSVGSVEGGFQTYLHIRSKKTFTVSSEDFPMELMIGLQESLSQLVGL